MNNPDFTTQLADIEIPAPLPATTDFIWLGLGLLVTALLITVIVLRRKKNTTPPAALALKKLDDLERQWQQGTLDTRQAAYQLATLLRLGLELKQLTCEQVDPACDKKLASTLRLLKTLRYEKSNISKSAHQASQQAFQHSLGHIRQCLNSAKRSNA